jgi:two-component sensor histidine kinase
MTDFSKILSDIPGLDAADSEWLHQLVSDWQVLADLAYADLILMVPVADGQFIAAGQCRPSTVASVRPDDVVGQLAPESMRRVLIQTMGERGLVEGETFFKSNNVTVRSSIVSDYACIQHDGKALGVLLRQADKSVYQSNDRYEIESVAAAQTLFSMVATGEFPYRDATRTSRHHARVPDGFVILREQGVIKYASPNAVSCFKRLGYTSALEGEHIAQIGESFLKDDENSELRYGDTLKLLAGEIAGDAELESNGATVSIRSFPLLVDSQYAGAVVLFREITELRRRDRELRMKDATIAEVHHRVKNNLQAVSALLRLQSRRTRSPQVRKELEEAMRRVQTIAAVHEVLSQNADEMVDFDVVISNLIQMSVELASAEGQHITTKFVGKFGMMPAQDATTLSLVMNELVTNAVEHGFEGKKEGSIIISVGRSGNHLNIVVEDDGVGLPPDAHDEKESGLGTQIIKTFVNSDFNGTVRWEACRQGGTRVLLDIKLRAA